MNIINNRFSTSVNIKRDLDTTDLYYLPTKNTEDAFKHILSTFSNTGQHAFNIIGAYGSGKSSFLWALEKTLNQKKVYFPIESNLFLSSIKSFETFAIVGEYHSLASYFAQLLEMGEGHFSGKKIIEKLGEYYDSLEKEGKGLLILIDEFGKFLEYAAKKEGKEIEYELYFVQQLAEFVNDNSKNILLISTLHQGVSVYFADLSQAKRNEWRKVEGRLQEITFNEPVEQLLSLAAKQLSEQKREIANKKQFVSLFESIKNAFPSLLRDYYTKEIAENLYPFDILSATVLTLSLQKYGQNERSLFSFLVSKDYLGINEFSEEGFYNLTNVYDYLFHNFHSYLTTKYNPDYTSWSIIKSSLIRIENYFAAGHISEEAYTDACKILKVIGLLNILLPHTGFLNLSFLEKYAKYALNIATNVAETLEMLAQYNIIRYRVKAERYILFSGSDVDIDKELKKAKEEIEGNFHLVSKLDEYFNLSYTIAKQVSYELGTPRIFSYRISEVPVSSFSVENEIDGYINLVFSTKITEREMIAISKNCKEAILFGIYKNTEEIRDLLSEIEAIKKVKQENSDDKVVFEELNILQEHETNTLNQYVINSLYQDNGVVEWYFQGEKKQIDSYKAFNRVLSTISQKVYYNVPTYRNEMVNKTKISSQISSARNAFLVRLMDNHHEADFGFAATAFPPEKTIYYSLLKETGIHQQIGNEFVLQKPVDESFLPLWEVGMEFLQTTKSNRRSVAEFIEILSNAPFKLKKGFIEFWLPVFLFINRDDFALFLEDAYVPNLTNDLIERMLKTPANFEVKMFDVEGVKLDIFNSYRALMNKTLSDAFNADSFIDTIRPFLTFYRGLDEYAKKTRRFSKHTLALREAIAHAKDPEKTFFEDFPNALGFNILELRDKPEELENFAFQLQSAIREIRTGYDELVKRLEIYLNETVLANLEIPETLKELSFPENKNFLQAYFKPIKKHLLLPHHLVFYQRVTANIDDRRSWIAAIAQACIGKQLDKLHDDDEFRLFDKLKAILVELDGLRTISKENITEGEEEIFEFSALSTNFKKKFRVSKQKIAENEKVAQKIQKLLTKDDNVNVAVLSHLLAEILKK